MLSLPICTGLGLLWSITSVLSMSVTLPAVVEPEPKPEGEDAMFKGGFPSAEDLADAIAEKLEKKKDVKTCGGTGGGSNCVFPFTYRNVDYYGCTSVAHTQPWCSTIGGRYEQHKKWGNCHCSPKGKELTVDPPTTCDGTAGGSRCVFPFIYQGKTYHGCTSVNHDRTWCSTTPGVYSGKWGNCDCVAETPTCGGTAGDHSFCRFPFHYDNVFHYDCITTSDKSKPWCGTVTGSVNVHNKWGFCGACDPPKKTCGGNANGAQCKFPFSYKGKKYYDCTSVAHTQLWCYTNISGKWGNCKC